MNESGNKSIKENYDFSYEGIVESLPIGTMVYQIKAGKTKIIAINDKLLQFANQIHPSVNANDNKVWDKNTLFAMFTKDLYVFSVDEDVPIVQELVREAAETGFSQKIFRLKGTEGEKSTYISSLCSCKDLEDGSKIFYTLFMDSTKQVLYEKQLLDKQKELENISQYDTLTNVCNRYSYNRYLEQNKASLKERTGIIFADMNGLKAANDEFGHLFGDHLILDFAEIILKYFDRNQVFRISGDEFVIILENIDVSDFEKQAKTFAREVSEQKIASVGYKWETMVVDIKQAIYQAEQLMMIQKQRYYVETSNKESKHRPKILRQLLSDMENGLFMVYLQPKAALGSNKVIGAEALIRKLGKDRKVVPPFEFVPILEKELLISKIDFFVLEEVCKLFAKWKQLRKRLISVSVNMSRVTVAESDFLDHVLSICDKYQVEHSYLEFEITESTDTKDNRKLPEIIIALAELGFSVSLDDMGSDYSSLKMLTMKGIEIIKIDRSLVCQIHDSEGAALIRYIIALCHELGKKCIAEGVENNEQAKILEDLGCDYYQGFLLNRPRPVNEFEAYLLE